MNNEQIRPIVKQQTEVFLERNRAGCGGEVANRRRLYRRADFRMLSRCSRHPWPQSVRDGVQEHRAPVLSEK
jgi:hypothetical protein